eukprot:7544_1
MKVLLSITFATFTLVTLCKGHPPGSKRPRSTPTLTADDRFEIQDLLSNIFHGKDQATLDKLNGDSGKVDAFVLWIESIIHDDFVLTLNGVEYPKQTFLGFFREEMRTTTFGHHVSQPLGFLSHDVSYVEDINGIEHVIEDVVVSYSARTYREFNYESPLLMRASTGNRTFRREDGGEFKNYGGIITIVQYATNAERTQFSKNGIVDYNNGWSDHSVWMMVIVGFIALILVVNNLICYWCIARRGSNVRYKELDKDSEDDSS